MTLDQLMKKHFDLTTVELKQVKLLKEPNKLLLYINAKEVQKMPLLLDFEKDVMNVLKSKHSIETVLHYPKEIPEPASFTSWIALYGVTPTGTAIRIVPFHDLNKFLLAKIIVKDGHLLVLKFSRTIK